MIRSKFDPLGKYLEFSGKAFLCLSFDEIEEIIQEKLYPSARKYRVYWSPSPTHTCALVIQEAGYQVEKVDFQGGKVFFAKKTS